MTRTKRIALFGTALLASALLTACSSGSSQQSANQEKPVGFVQLASENKERIWYGVEDSNGDNEVSKDDKIETILVTKDGKVSQFFLSDATLADIKGMKNTEIVTFAKEQDKKYFDDGKAYKIEDAKAAIAELEDFIKEGYSGYQEDLISNQEYLAELEDINYKDIKSQYSDYTIHAIVETDSSGNNVATESLKMKGYPSLAKLTEAYDVTAKLQYLVNGDIYDQSYTGYHLQRKEFLITNINSLEKGTVLGFDTLDTKNVTEE